MADINPNVPDWLANAPTFTLNPPPPPPQPDNWLTSGLKSGFLGAVSGLGGAVQAGSTALGMPGIAASGQRVAAGAGAAAQQAARPDIEALPWYHPERIAYNLAQSAPLLPAAIASGGGATGLAGAARAGAVFLPSMIGQNVEQETATHGGELSQGGALKAIGLGVPEALGMGFMPGGLSKIIDKGAEGALAHRILTGAGMLGAYQGLQNAATTAINQQAYTPDMPMSDRVRSIVDEGLSGFVQGGLLGGAFSALRGRIEAVKGSPDKIPTDALKTSVDSVVAPLQLTDQRGNRPMPVTPGGQAGENLFATQNDLTARAGLGAQSQAPGTPLLEAPTPGSTAEMELRMRTPPGSTLIPGGIMFSPEEAAARAPLVDAFKQQVMEGLGGQNAVRAEKHPFFQNFNATDEPELIGLLKDQLSKFDEQNKTPPKWFQTIANDFGVMKGDQDAPDPQKVVADVETRMADVQKAREGAKTKQENMQLATQFKGLSQELEEAKQIAAWHDTASSRLGTMKAAALELPAEPTGDQLLNHPVIKTNLADLKIDATKRVPDAAGVDVKDPSLVHVDSRIPATATIEGVETPVQKLVAVHEIAEAELVKQLQAKNPDMDPQKLYQASHVDGGVVAERKAVRDFAVANDKDPGVFERAYNGWWDSQIKEAAKPSETPLADVAKYPYVHDHSAAGKEEMNHAVQEPGATGVDVFPAPGNGEGVGSAHPEGQAVAQEAPRGNDETHWEKFARENPQPEVPEGLVSNMEAPGGGRVLRDLTGEEEKLPQPATHVEPPIRKQDLIRRAREPAKLMVGTVTPEEGRSAAEAAQRMQAGERVQLQKLHDAEPEGSPRQQFAARALATNDSTGSAVRRALNTMALDDELSGRKARSSAVPSLSEIEGKPVPRNETPGWAQAHADDLHGDAIYHDDENALVRAFNAKGDSIYVPVNRALGLRTFKDVKSTNAAWVTSDVRDKLGKLEDRARAADAAAYAKNPDGPFKNTQGNVVGTPNADPRMVSYVSGLMRQLGLGDVRVLLTHPSDVRGTAGDAMGLHGDYQSARTSGANVNDEGHVRSFGPGNKDFYIYLKPGLGDTKSIEIAAHEVGHIVETVALRGAPEATKQAINSAYTTWYRMTSGMTMQDVIKSVHNREISSYADDPNFNQPMTTGMRNHMNYVTSFSEWFADNVSRWATTAEKPRGIVEQFFSAVGQRLKELFTAVTGQKFAPAAAVKDFLDRMGPGSAQQWLTERSLKGAAKIPVASEEARASRTPAEAETDTRNFIASTQSLWSRLGDKVRDLGVAARKSALIAESYSGLTRIGGRELTSAEPFRLGHQQREAIKDGMSKADLKSMAGYRTTTPENRVIIDAWLGALQNKFGIDARKPLGDYAERLGGMDPAAQEAFKAQYTAQKGLLDRVRQSGNLKAAEDVLRMWQTKGWQSTTAQMQLIGARLAKMGITIPAHGVDAWKTPENLTASGPHEAMQFMSGLHDDPEKMHGFFKDAHEAMLAGLKEYAAQGGPDAIGIRAEVKRLADFGKEIDKGTYLPLKHGKGYYFAAGKVALGENNVPRPESLDALQDALHKNGFDNLGLNFDSDSNAIFARVDDAGTMERLRNVFQDLEAKGHMLPDETRAGGLTDIDTIGKLGPKQFAAIKQTVDDITSRMNPDDAAKMKQQLMANFLDTQPDHSTLPQQLRRTYAQGFEKDIGRVAAEVASNSTRATANVAMSGKIQDLLGNIRAETLAAKSDPKIDVRRQSLMQDTANEIQRREVEAGWRLPSGAIEMIQSGMHTLMIGFNPAYTILPISQIPTLLHGELAKHYGYMKSAQAIGSVTNESFKVMAAIMKSPDRWNFGMREEALRAAGISEKTTKTLMQAANSGMFTSFTQSQGYLGEGFHEKLEGLRDRANMMGVYAEQLPRVIAALAAAKLHDASPGNARMDRASYVNHVIGESQYNWGLGETSRLTGAKGPMGRVGRLTFAFTQYQTRMLEKLFTETRDLMMGGNQANTRAEAGKFLASHLAAVAVLSGTLGLPFASFAGGLYDKMAKTLTGRDDIDLEGSYRTWLANVFGKDVGEVLAKGLPRALGVDVSKIGDANLLPGTGIMIDKRKFEDASKDWYQSMAGAAIGEGGRFYLGARDLMNGDYMMGAIKMLPEGFKGLAEAEYAREHGYTNKFGQRLPIQPSTADIAKMAVGIDPANLAQYNEANRIKQGLTAQREWREQNIGQHLARAQAFNDPAMLQEWIREGIAYQMQHPGMGSPLQGMMGAMKQRMIASAEAQAFGMPIGVKPIDFAMRNAVGFVNPNQ